MAVNYVWPASLPQLPLQGGYGEANGVLVARTKMDKGPAKLRRLGRRPDVLAVSYQLTTAQVATLDSFIDNSLRGVRRFGWPHPRLQTQVEARIVPQDDGKLYDVTAVAPGMWQVSLSVEVLP